MKLDTSPTVIRSLKKALIAWVVSIVCLKLIGYVNETYMADWNPFVVNLIRQAIFSCIVFGFYLYTKRINVFKVNFQKLKGALFTPFFFYFILLVNASGTELSVTVKPWEIGLFILHMFLVGFSEELLFRGIMQNAFHDLFTEKTVWRVRIAILISGFVFGMTHITNSFDHSIPIANALIQGLSTSFAGVLFGAIYFRSGKCLWLPIFVHALNDTVGFYQNGYLSGKDLSESIVSSTQAMNASDPMTFLLSILPLAVVYLGISYFILRKSKVEPLLDQNEQIVVEE